MEDESSSKHVGRLDKNNTLWVPLNTLNPHLVCGICQGYLYEACTITECMHSFCKNCLVKHLVRSLNCPVCAIVIHPTDPFVHIRFDALLQDIVYVLLPHVKKNELEKEKTFYKEHQGELDYRGKELINEHQNTPTTPKDDSLTKHHPLSRPVAYIPPVSICLQYIKACEDDLYTIPKQFVRVTGAATIKNLINFMRLKLDLRETFKLEFYCPSRSGFVFLSKGHTLRAVKDLYFHNEDILPLKYDITESCDEL